MPCRPFTLGDSTFGFVCSRGPKARGRKKFCVVCLKEGRKVEAPLLCDFPKPGGGTCDAGLCPRHTNRVRAGVAYCPEHSA